jgi:hypothetical protein
MTMTRRISTAFLVILFCCAAVSAADESVGSGKAIRSNYELYLDFLDGTPQKGKPIRFKARALTGNAHKRTEFLMDSDCPLSGGAEKLSTVYRWSYVWGTVTFRQAGECKLKVAFKLVFVDNTFRIIDRDFDIYVMN